MLDKRESKRSRPNLFQYDDYRKYLSDWFGWMKATKSGFSYRAFSRWAGFKSPNQLLLVVEGKRNIPLASLGKYFQVLKLNVSERRYFELLVKFNQAKDMPSKTEYFHELSAYWLKKGTFLRSEQYEYLSNWYYPAIREMVNLKDFRESGAWISKRLGGLITPAPASQAIETLLRLKLLKRLSEGHLVQTTDYVTTGEEIESVAGFLYHEQMMRLAIESLKEKPSTERNLTGLTFTMKKQDYERVVGLASEFRKKVISYLQNRETTSGDDGLYQLNIHLFPIRRG